MIGHLQVADRSEAAHAGVREDRGTPRDGVQRKVGQVRSGVASVGAARGFVVVPQPQQRLVARQLVPEQATAQL